MSKTTGLLLLAFTVLLVNVWSSPTPTSSKGFDASPSLSDDGDRTSKRQELIHTLDRRTHFFDIQCKGVYEKSIFAKLDRICEDCYNLYEVPQVLAMCRSECFSTKNFQACLTALLREDDGKAEDYREMVEYVG